MLVGEKINESLNTREVKSKQILLHPWRNAQSQRIESLPALLRHFN